VPRQSGLGTHRHCKISVSTTVASSSSSRRLQDEREEVTLGKRVDFASRDNITINREGNALAERVRFSRSASVTNNDVLNKFTRQSSDQQKDRDKEHTVSLANKEAGAATAILAPARKADMMENFMMNSSKTRTIEDGREERAGS
jgi:hypothetical protein